MGLLVLLVVHAALSVAGFALLWRRLDRQRLEITRLKEQLTTSRAAVAPAMKRRTAEGAAVVSITELAPQRIASARAVSAQQAPVRQRKTRAATLSPETARALVLSLLAVAPALGFFIDGGANAAVASGLAIAAAMMVIALRPVWSVAAWASVLTASAWAAIGFALNTVASDPWSYSIFLALAGVIGILNAHLRNAAPGAAMALVMAGAALALGGQIGMFSAAGAAYAAIVSAAAIVGALSLRLDALHLAAFGATVIGLFVLSGQDGAAIWFTPVASWAGALFFAIAVVRVPQLGARGVALAGTGAFAPIGVIAALHAAGHGLASPYAAAAALIAFGALLSGLIALATQHRDRGLAALRLTLWVLVLGAFTAFAAGIALAAPAHLAAPAFAMLALAYATLDARLTNRIWRVLAVISMLIGAAFAIVAAGNVLAESIAPLFAASAGIALPALLGGASAYAFERSGAHKTAALLEASAFALGIVVVNLAARVAFAGGATLLQPITFVEAATHCTIWLAASLLAAWRRDHGARGVREAVASGGAIAALAGLLMSGVLWLAGVWGHAPDGAWFSRDSLAFLIPSALLWGHWLFWRNRKTAKRTRVAFAAGALSLAVFVALELMAIASVPTWTKILGVALVTALALGGNFVAGVTADGERLKLREKAPSRSAPQGVR